jgi:poly(hydroxyalkanoate) depolymerase family esterase
MAGLGRTIANLARHRRSASGGAPRDPGRLRAVTGFGPNPGNLRMLAHVPARLAPRAGLVVVLHGCRQSAAGYDLGTGWSELAERHGFAVLYPEQQQANNPNNCFSWFEPARIARGAGEAASIHAMVAWMIETHGLDAGRVFITGLSAGGAMTASMLAAYPEVFAAGAVIAGLPHGAASGVREAFASMFEGPDRPARAWGDLVRTASRHPGPWPRLAIWHGTADTTVVPANADELAKQWTNLHGIPLSRAEASSEGTASRRVWRDRDGAVAVEQVMIPGLAHGTPLATSGPEACGRAGPFLLEAGISSTHRIAGFFGLLEDVPSVAARHVPERPTAERPAAERPMPEHALPERAATESAERPRPKPGRAGARPTIDVEAVIVDALRAAGLMRR